MIHNLILVHREMDFFSVLDLGKLNCSYSRSWKRTVLVWWGCWYLWNTKCHKKESIELQNDPSEAFLHSQLPRTLAALQGGKLIFAKKSINYFWTFFKITSSGKALFGILLRFLSVMTSLFRDGFISSWRRKMCYLHLTGDCMHLWELSDGKLYWLK